MSTSWDKVEQFARDHLEEMLSRCTNEQQELFYRMYPEGPQGMEFDKINHAFSQIDRTLEEE